MNYLESVSNLWRLYCTDPLHVACFAFHSLSSLYFVLSLLLDPLHGTCIMWTSIMWRMHWSCEECTSSGHICISGSRHVYAIICLLLIVEHPFDLGFAVAQLILIFSFHVIRKILCDITALLCIAVYDMDQCCPACWPHVVCGLILSGLPELLMFGIFVKINVKIMPLACLHCHDKLILFKVLKCTVLNQLYS